jgi:hypothetical protein
MELRLVEGCEDINCPKAYATDGDTVVIQGFVVDDPDVLARARPSEGEALVEIPRQLLVQAVRKLATGDS